MVTIADAIRSALDALADGAADTLEDLFVPDATARRYIRERFASC
jgi:hypothetical protein